MKGSYVDCNKKDILLQKYYPFLSITEEKGLCVSNWSLKYEKILERFYVWDLLKENLCYQKSKPTVLKSPIVTANCQDSEMINFLLNDSNFYFSHTKTDWYNCAHIFKRKIKEEKPYVPPKLKKCELWEKPWDYYENCCPVEEYNMLIFKKKIEKTNLFLEKKELKTETKEVMIPIDKPLSIEQTWLLENTIFSVFTIVKFFMR